MKIEDKKQIGRFVDNMLSRDSLALRKHIQTVTPDVDMKVSFTSEASGDDHEIHLPMGVSFFWPGV